MISHHISTRKKNNPARNNIPSTISFPCRRLFCLWHCKEQAQPTNEAQLTELINGLRNNIDQLNDRIDWTAFLTWLTPILSVAVGKILDIVQNAINSGSSNNETADIVLKILKESNPIIASLIVLALSFATSAAAKYKVKAEESIIDIEDFQEYNNRQRLEV